MVPSKGTSSLRLQLLRGDDQALTCMPNLCGILLRLEHNGMRKAIPHLDFCQRLQLRQSFQPSGGGQQVHVCPSVPEARPGRLCGCLAPAADVYLLNMRR